MFDDFGDWSGCMFDPETLQKTDESILEVWLGRGDLVRLG
jgi:hypothetical protein